MWADGNLVAFDLETTGVDPETARIVTACAVEVGPNGLVDRRGWLADPGVDIPAEATAVHGITTEHARAEGRPIDEVVVEIGTVIQDAWARGLPIVVYNAPYDLTLLDREMRRSCDSGIELLTPPGQGVGPVVDPLVIDKALDRYRRGGRKLVDVCRHHGIALPPAEAHTSAGDAMAAARLAWKLARRYDVCTDLDVLQERQATWHAEWAEGFERHLRSQGKHEPISRDWPIRPFVEQAGAVA
jgi:DNA polymerase-3 subunit epsilon